MPQRSPKRFERSGGRKSAARSGMARPSSRSFESESRALRSSSSRTSNFPRTSEETGKGLDELLLTELQDIYHAERQLLKALPKMAKAASATDLRDAFESHLEETEAQIGRLEQVFVLLGERPKTNPCEGMKGLIEEANELMEEEFSASVNDAALISSAQKVEHYEIASYGCLCAWAKWLSKDEALELLKQNLEEEKAADEKLTQIAESAINAGAAAQRQ